MYCLSSPLTLKELLKLKTNVLLVIIFTLYITSCEARHLRINVKYYSIKEPSSLQIPSKAVTEVGATKKLQMLRASVIMVHNLVLDQEFQGGGKIDQSMGTDVLVKTKKEVASPGAGRSSRHSSRRSEGNKVRSGARELAVLGVEFSSREQVGSKATTAYAAETLVAMDYPVAHPAPAIHNR